MDQKDCRKLIDWYECDVRPFLETHSKERVLALDNERDRLKKFLERRDGITVCFIGATAIGKSTLLNALAAGDRQVLPAGGVGPLTAQATEVHYSEVPEFTVAYHTKVKLLRLGFALERRLERLNKPAAKNGGGKIQPQQPEIFARDLDEAERTELIAEERSVEPTAEDNGTENVATPIYDPVEDYIKQAKQLVTGNQFSPQPLPYLIDALTLACGGELRWHRELEPEDMKRVTRLKAVLEFAKAGKAFSERQSDSTQSFYRDLQDHVAGFLSPLIKKITVGWPSELLKEGVVLVDLPGVGIAQDAYREVTKKYVREQARAIVLVVDRAGPTEASVDLLRSSGYWDRLVGASDDPSSDPCHMLIAVTRVDDVAAEEWATTAHLPKEERPKRRQVFLEKLESFKPRIIDQITSQLSRLTPSDNAVVQHARQEAAKRILTDLKVFPLSAPEYRRILANDEEEQPHIVKNAEDSGVPLMIDALAALSRQEREGKQSAISEVSQRFSRSIDAELTIVESLWREQDHAAAEADKLREALDEFLGPKGKEYDRRSGAFREFLDATIQTRIRELVLEARLVAEEEVNKYLMGLRYEHWAALRAAVRKGGVWIHGRGKPVNLPDDIANYFQEPMAAVWSQKLLKEVRKRTAELAQDISAMVEEICVWANENAATTVNKEVLNRQTERIKDHTAQLKQVGKEAVDELRQIVKEKLGDAIKTPIRKSCDDFVEKGDDIGRGVKQRILELFERLARQATKTAEEPATKVLLANFKSVRADIQAAFEEWGDPLQETASLIVERYQDRQKRSDAQRRRKVLAAIEQVRATNPVINETKQISAGVR